MQTFFLVADDIMDESCLRRNKLCWYKKVGLSAINDSILLESFLFLLLKMHFQDRPHTHIGLFSLFRDVILRTSLGQALDMKCESLKSPQMSFERYQQIVVYKTGFYTFYLPVKSALILKGIDIDDAHLMPILLGLGELFQIQDDYLDCFGDPSITGKIGTDIQDFKCSWCVLTALSIDGDACDVLKENYGKESGVETVRSYYKRLDIPAIYERECLSRKSKLSGVILENSHLPAELKAILQGLVDRLLHRSS